MGYVVPGRATLNHFIFCFARRFLPPHDEQTQPNVKFCTWGGGEEGEALLGRHGSLPLPSPNTHPSVTYI